MMRLVHNDGRKVILRKLLQAFFLTQGLHRTHGNRHIAAKGAGASLLISTFHSGDLLHLVCCLIQQFAAMRHDQGTATLIYFFFHYGGKAHRLAAPGRENQKRTLPALRPLVQDGILCFSLIRTELNRHA